MDDWIKAAEGELSELTAKGTWTEVHKKDLPPGANVLPGTWALKIKRYPDGSFRKFKARYCVRGDKQLEGIDYFQTYAPVVSWLSVRMLLILTIFADLSTVQVDYSNAFAQGILNEVIYLKLPASCTGKFSENTVLKLNRSLYGLKQAAVCWFDKLKDGLLAQGWTQPLPHLEPCLFVKKGVICLVYVDDCLFFARDKTQIDTYIKEIQDAGFALSIEKDVYAFLGVEFNIDPTTKKCSLTQTGLIDKIIKMAGMEDGNKKYTPADKIPLGPCEDEPPHDESWSYASIFGCLNYLANNSRPDIQFAVHQCARYTHSPKKSHSQALKRIVRYLIGTRDKGLVLSPTKEITLDMYADADFAGMWNSNATEQDPVRVKSRSGHVILLGNCPLLWSSKLQTEIACSTLEAEFIALSSAMRDLIPARLILQVIGKALPLPVPEGALLKSTVFEDNNGCLTLATIPKMTPRSKHIAIKFFWFKSKVGPEHGIQIVKCDTKDMLADIFTKGLTSETFSALRALLMGWTSAREGVSQDKSVSNGLLAYIYAYLTKYGRSEKLDMRCDDPTSLPHG